MVDIKQTLNLISFDDDQALASTHFLDVKSDGVQSSPFASLAAVLHEHEPHGFALARLLADGALRTICAAAPQLRWVPDPALNDWSDVKRKVKQAVRDIPTLMKVIAHFAFVLPLPAVVSTDEDQLPKSQSKLVLEPLSLPLHDSLAQYNQRVLAAFVDMCRLLTREQQNEVDVAAQGDLSLQLPLTRVQFDSQAENAAASSELAAAVASRALSFEARSPFVALSGHDDGDFESARELVDTVQSGLSLTRPMVPTSELRAFRGLALARNAFANDFFRHEQMVVIMRDNGLTATQSWAFLKGMSQFLEQLSNYASELAVDAATDPVVETLKELARCFAVYLRWSAWSDLA